MSGPVSAGEETATRSPRPVPGGPHGANYGLTALALHEAGRLLNEAALSMAAAGRALTTLALLPDEEPPDPPLVGAALGRVGVEVARSVYGGQSFHYRELLLAVERLGHRVGGNDPAATLLNAILRRPEVERVGHRSGLYVLKSWAR